MSACFLSSLAASKISDVPRHSLFRRLRSDFGGSEWSASKIGRLTRLAVSPGSSSPNVLFSIRSIQVLRLGIWSAHDVIARVDIFDVPGECGSAVADQEGRNVTTDPRCV